jgi:thiamine biosynthesis lipoprotein
MAATVGTCRVEHVMGMPIVVDVRDESIGDAALEQLFEWLRFVDSIFSTYRHDSEISRLNRGELDLGDAHPDVREVLERCDELRLQTEGYFDVRAASPDELDPSGLVKGWSVERGAEILDRAGVSNYAVNAGGDIVVRGGALPDSYWSIGIEHPMCPNAVAAVIEATDMAVATSATYARGDHVLDPHTRRPPRDVLSVTIVGPELGTADAYATAAYAMGVRGPHWTARLPRGYEAMTILADESVLTTSGFPRTTDGLDHRRSAQRPPSGSADRAPAKTDRVLTRTDRPVRRFLPRGPCRPLRARIRPSHPRRAS